MLQIQKVQGELKNQLGDAHAAIEKHETEKADLVNEKEELLKQLKEIERQV